MSKLMEQFILNFNTGDIWVGFLALAIFYILKKEPFKIITHFSERKIKDIEQAKSLLESDKLSKDINSLIREHLENYAFRKYCGINANKEKRQTLIKFHQKYKSIIGWHDLRRASAYLGTDDSEIKVNLRWYNHLNRWVVTGLSYFIGGYSLIIIILAVLTKYNDQVQFIAFTFLSVMLLFSALFFSSINWPYHSAVKISSCVKNSNK
jgi:VIT1/CCC1 family predicted Fe2+/Mn2+ transporter